jgi:hypothetical protein
MQERLFAGSGGEAMLVVLARATSKRNTCWISVSSETFATLSGVKRTTYAQCEFFRLMEGLSRIERTDGDVISVRISERKLRSSSAGIHMWLFFQPADERARPWPGYVKVVDPEEQEEPLPGLA